MTFKIRINILLLWGVSVDPGCKMWNPVTTIQGRVGWIIQANQQCWHAPTLLDAQKSLMQKCSEKNGKVPKWTQNKQEVPQSRMGGLRTDQSGATTKLAAANPLTPTPARLEAMQPLLCSRVMHSSAHTANSVNNFDMKQHSNVWYPIEMYLWTRECAIVHISHLILQLTPHGRQHFRRRAFFLKLGSLWTWVGLANTSERINLRFFDPSSDAACSVLRQHQINFRLPEDPHPLPRSDCTNEDEDCSSCTGEQISERVVAQHVYSGYLIH